MTSPAGDGAGSVRALCPRCGSVVDRGQRSRGVVAVYPCNCWLTPDEASHLAQRHRRAREMA